jgi:3-phenylpropionate/trans-cinnamate dioxygenase ferredoxin subunit
LDDVAPGTTRRVVVDGVALLLCNAGGAIYAIEDVCSHDGAPLDQGELDANCIVCPRHGARFDVTTGAALTLPAVLPVQTYPARVEDGSIYVET